MSLLRTVHLHDTGHPERDGHTQRALKSTGQPGLPWSGLPAAVAAVPDVDRVEVKVIVAREHHERATSVLAGELSPVETRRVWFLDSPDLRLYRRGLVLRTRTIHRPGTAGPHADVVVKLRSATAPDLSAEVYRWPGLSVDLDALPDTASWSAALKHVRDEDEVLTALEGTSHLRTLFTPEQSAFLRAGLGSADFGPGDIDVDELMVLGPAVVTKMRAGRRCSSGAATTIECWHYPDGSQVVEISTASRPSQAVRVAAQTARMLTEHGIRRSRAQRTKTYTALAQFADRGPGTCDSPAGQGPAG